MANGHGIAHPAAVSELPYMGRRARPLIAVQCVECGRLSEGRWQGWGAYRIDDHETDEPPELAPTAPNALEQFGAT